MPPFYTSRDLIRRINQTGMFDPSTSRIEAQPWFQNLSRQERLEAIREAYSGTTKAFQTEAIADFQEPPPPKSNLLGLDDMLYGGAANLIKGAAITAAAITEGLSAIQGKSLPSQQQFTKGAGAAPTGVSGAIYGVAEAIPTPEFRSPVSRFLFQDVAQGIGTSATILGVGAAAQMAAGAAGVTAATTQAVGLGSLAITGITAGSGSAYREALAKGATDEEARMAASVGAALGATEALPLMSMLPARQIGLRGIAAIRSGRIASEALEEGTQELFQSAMQEASLRAIRGEADFATALGEAITSNETLYNAFVGAVSGGIMGGVIHNAVTQAPRLHQTDAQRGDAGVNAVLRRALEESAANEAQTDTGADFAQNVAATLTPDEPLAPEAIKAAASLGDATQTLAEGIASGTITPIPTQDGATATKAEVMAETEPFIQTEAEPDATTIQQQQVTQEPATQPTEQPEETPQVVAMLDDNQRIPRLVFEAPLGPVIAAMPKDAASDIEQDSPQGVVLKGSDNTNPVRNVLEASGLIEPQAEPTPPSAAIQEKPKRGRPRKTKATENAEGQQKTAPKKKKTVGNAQAALESPNKAISFTTANVIAPEGTSSFAAPVVARDMAARNPEITEVIFEASAAEGKAMMDRTQTDAATQSFSSNLLLQSERLRLSNAMVNDHTLPFRNPFTFAAVMTLVRDLGIPIKVVPEHKLTRATRFGLAPEALARHRQLLDKDGKPVKNAIGRYLYDPKKREILLRADTAEGQLVSQQVITKDKATNEFIQQELARLLKEINSVSSKPITADDILINKKVVGIDTSGTWMNVQFILKGQEYAKALVGHELGHIIHLIQRNGELHNSGKGILRDLAVALGEGFNAKHLFGEDAKENNVREELLALSLQWRPPGMPFEKAKEDYQAYRKSKNELYADFISAVLVAPGFAQRMAPISWNIFTSRIKRKPAVRRAIEEIGDLLTKPGKLADRVVEDLIQSSHRGIKARMQVDHPTSFITRTVDLLRWWLINRDFVTFSAIRKVQKYGTDTAKQIAITARDNLTKLRGAGFIDTYRKRLAYEVEMPLLKNGVSIADFGAYLTLRHAKENRQSIYNGRITSANVDQLLASIRRSVGAERYSAIERAAENFYQIRQDLVVPRFLESGIGTPEFNETMQKRRAYARWLLVRYIEEKKAAHLQSFSDQTEGVTTFSQLGSGSDDVANAFIETMLQDEKMLLSAQSVIAIRDSINVLRELDAIPQTQLRHAKTKAILPRVIKIDVTKRFANGRLTHQLDEKKAMEIAHQRPDLQVIMYRQGNDILAYAVPEKMAKAFDSEESNFGGFGDIVHYGFGQIYRNLYTIYNPAFFTSNPFRDVNRTASLLPTRSGKHGVFTGFVLGFWDSVYNHWKVGKGYFGSFREAFNHISGREFSQFISDAMQSGVAPASLGALEPGLTDIKFLSKSDDKTIDLGTIIETAGLPDPERYKKFSSWRSIDQAVYTTFELIRILNQTSEVAAKTNAYSLLKTVRPDLSNEQAADYASTFAGTPPHFITPGGQRITNNVFIYSTVWMRSWESAARAAQILGEENGAAYAAGRFSPAVLYGSVAAMLKLGGVSYITRLLAEALDIEPPEEFLRYAEDIELAHALTPDYYLKSHLVLPFMFTGTPSAVGPERLSSIAIRIPFDETSRIVVSTAYELALAAMSRELGTRDAITGVIGNFAREGISFSPSVSLYINALAILGGGAGYDYFRQKPILSEVDQASTLGTVTAFLRWAASETSARNFTPFLFVPQGAQAKKLDEFFAFPLIGPIVRRLMVVSNNGHEELAGRLYYAKYGRQIKQDQGIIQEYATQVSNAIARGKQEIPEPTDRQIAAMERLPEYTQRLMDGVQRRFSEGGIIQRLGISQQATDYQTGRTMELFGNAIMRRMD